MSDYDDDSVMRGMRDIDAMSREHSHVSAETFNRLSAIARSAAHPVKSSTIARARGQGVGLVGTRRNPG